MQRAIIALVQRPLKKLTALILMSLFTVGVWCASLAAPELSIASATQRCPQNSLSMGKMDCDQPNFMCSLRPNPTSLTSAVIPARTHELGKAVTLSVGAAEFAGPPYETALATTGARAVNLHFPEKVPIYLFNSILNL